MTVDIHFRLDEHEPQGHLALTILAAWEQQGYATDEIVARALLALGERHQAQQTSTTLASVKDIIRQMRDLLREAQLLAAVRAPGLPADASAPQPDSSHNQAELSQAFLNAVKKAARPGLRLEA
jgi:hypothetical protein